MQIPLSWEPSSPRGEFVEQACCLLVSIQMNLLMRTFSACVVSLKCQILAEMDCTVSTEGT